jgi:hypothetical protein
MALYANSLFDLAAELIPRTGNPLVVIVSALNRALTYAISLFDPAAAPTLRTGNPVAVIVSDLDRGLEVTALPALWFLVFAGALVATRLLLPPRDRGTLRWLGQAWFAALVSYAGGLTLLPRGLLLIDVFLFCGSAEGARVAFTGLVRRLSEPLVEAT